MLEFTLVGVNVSLLMRWEVRMFHVGRRLNFSLTDRSLWVENIGSKDLSGGEKEAGL